MVQTGFKAEAHCWKCFKENHTMSVIDGKPINLCKGCIYVLKIMSQWLNAYGLGIRQMHLNAGSTNIVTDNVVMDNVVGEGIEGVEGGGNPVVDDVIWKPAT